MRPSPFQILLALFPLPPTPLIFQGQAQEAFQGPPSFFQPYSPEHCACSSIMTPVPV